MNKLMHIFCIYKFDHFHGAVIVPQKDVQFE